MESSDHDVSMDFSPFSLSIDQEKKVESPFSIDAPYRFGSLSDLYDCSHGEMSLSMQDLPQLQSSNFATMFPLAEDLAIPDWSKHREASRLWKEDDSDMKSLKDDPSASRRLHFLASQIVIDSHLCKAFTRWLAAPGRQSDAQVIFDCIHKVLCEGETRQKDDSINMLRLLYQLADETKLYPNFLTLKGVELAVQPFAGSGFADVFEGKYDSQKVCVKVIRVFGQDKQSELLRAYVREIILWSHMSHKNILPLIGTFVLDEVSQRICLVSPFMHRGNIQTFLKTSPETPRLPLVLGITEGLSYLHRRDIIHGALKAQNVLVSDDDRALLADFGFSYIVRTTAGGSTRLSAVGMTNWMAPELITEEQVKPTKTSDIWSFGCLSYEIFTGMVPFYQYHNQAQVVLALIVRGELPIRPHIDACRELDDWVWEKLMLGCWVRAPESRQTCDMILAQLTTEVVRTGRPNVNSKEQKLASRNRTMDTEVDNQRAKEILVAFWETCQEYVRARVSDETPGVDGFGQDGMDLFPHSDDDILSGSRLMPTSTKIREAADRKRTRARTFVCDICRDSFTTSQNLKNHYNSHTGISPFSCGDCGKKYRHSRSLNRHRAQTHHDAVVE